ITAYDIDDAPQGAAFVGALGTGDLVTITAVRVFDQNGNLLEDSEGGGAPPPKVGIHPNPDGAAAGHGPPSGYKVEWDTNALHEQVLIEGVVGKFDIGGFGVAQPQPTPDQQLDFTAQATDGDGDFDTASFSIGIDGTGIFDDGMVPGVLTSAST